MRIARPAIFIVFLAAGCGESFDAARGKPPLPPSTAAAPSAPVSPARESAGPAKAAPPLDLQFWFESEPSPGATVKLGLGVTPRIDLPACELAFLLPEDVPVVEGAREWRGPLARDRFHAVFLTVRVPDAARRLLRGRAQAAFPDGSRVGRVAELVLNGRSPEKPAAEPGVLKTNARGEPIIEFPAESPK